jgi:hypothetical protein
MKNHKKLPIYNINSRKIMLTIPLMPLNKRYTVNSVRGDPLRNSIIFKGKQNHNQSETFIQPTLFAVGPKWGVGLADCLKFLAVFVF